MIESFTRFFREGNGIISSSLALRTRAEMEPTYESYVDLDQHLEQVKTMQQLIEFYEMVSLNDAALRDSERTAILKARLALHMFERAMESFKTGSTEATCAAEASLRIAIAKS